MTGTVADTIIQKIESLPPLPQTLQQIEEFRQKNEKEAFELLQIIEKDALIVSTLLKVSNSAMFGFRSKVETASKAINLLGINFTISIAIGGTIQNLLKSNLSAYGINSDDFMKASNLATTLTAMWLNKLSFDLKEELVLPALLQEAGKFVLADVLDAENKKEEFKSLLKDGKTICEAEDECLGITTSKITAKIFKHWKLSDNLINVIENVDDISKCEESYKVKSMILDVVRTICEVRDPMSIENIEMGLIKAKSYDLDTKSLKETIQRLQSRLEEEE